MTTSEKTTSNNELPGSKKNAVCRTASYYASYISLGLVIAVLGPTLPGLAEHTGTKLSEISFLFTAHSFGYLLGSLLGGRLYDRTSGHPLMASALLIMMVVMAMVPFIPYLWLLAIVLLVVGSAEGILDVGGNTLLVWVHKNRVAPFMNGLHFFFGLGALISPLIVGKVISITNDINWAYWVLALIIFPVALLLFRIPSPGIQRQTEDSVSKRGNYFLIGLISLFFFLHVGGELSFGGWIYTYAVSVDLADKTVAAYLTSAFWGSLTLGRLLGIPIASRVKPRYVLIGNLAGCVLGTGIIFLYSRSAAVLWIGSILTGLSISSLFPMSLTFAGRHLHINGQVTSWFLVGASVGSMFLPWFIGQLFESIGPQVTMIFIMIDYLAALGLFLFILYYAFKSTPDRK